MYLALQVVENIFSKVSIGSFVCLQLTLAKHSLVLQIQVHSWPKGRRDWILLLKDWDPKFVSKAALSSSKHPLQTLPVQGSPVSMAREELCLSFSGSARVCRADSMRIFPTSLPKQRLLAVLLHLPPVHMTMHFSSCPYSVSFPCTIIYVTSTRVFLIFTATAFFFVLYICFIFQYLFRNISTSKRPRTAPSPKWSILAQKYTWLCFL